MRPSRKVGGEEEVVVEVRAEMRDSAAEAVEPRGVMSRAKKG